MKILYILESFETLNMYFFLWGGAWVFKSICRFKELRDLGYLGNLAYFESLGYLGNLVKLEDSGY